MPCCVLLAACWRPLLTLSGHQSQSHCLCLQTPDDLYGDLLEQLEEVARGLNVGHLLLVVRSTSFSFPRWLRLTRRRTSSWNGSATGNASGRRCSRPRLRRGAACK